jgi:hypothetical protein
MRVYHDWEFLETGNSVYPISVGMVREDGQDLYWEFSDAPWELIHKHEWLMHNVVPILDLHYNGKNTEGIRAEVKTFLKTAAADDNGKLELWGWYSGYDHVCLGQLFGAMVNFPSYVPMWTNDLRQEVHRLGNPDIPDLREPGEIVHHAYDDAVAEMRMHQWLIRYERDGKLHDCPTPRHEKISWPRDRQIISEYGA